MVAPASADPRPNRSSVVHPPKSRLVIIREDYLAICEGNACAAALLQNFDFWHTVRLDHQETPDQFKRQEKMRTEILNIWSEKTMRTALKSLVQKSFIWTAPNNKRSTDRTLRYGFNPQVVQKAVHEWTVDRDLEMAQNEIDYWFQYDTNGYFFDTVILPNAPLCNRQICRMQSVDLPSDAVILPSEGVEITGSLIEKTLRNDLLESESNTFAASLPLAAHNEVPSLPDRQNGQSLTERKDLEPITASKTLPRAVLQAPYEYRMTPSDNEQVQHIIAHDGARGCLCKRTPFKSPKVPLSEHEIGAVVCSGCLREYQRQTAPKVRKPSIDQPVKDAIAQHIQRITPDMQTKYTGVLANLAIGAWKKKLKTDKLAVEQYEKIARSFDSENGFLDFYKRECKDCALPTGRDTFEDWYTRFVDSLNGGGVKPKDETVTIECLTDWGAWTERDVRKSDLPTLTYQWRIPAWQKSA